MRITFALAALIGAFVIGAAAQAATGWHVFATGQDSGDYGAFASANASVTRPHGLAIRVSKDAEVSWNLSCDGDTQVAADRVFVLNVTAGGTCRVYASANTDTAGLLRLQLLKK